MSVSLLSGNTLSCGCNRAGAPIRHGFTTRGVIQPEYRCWSNLKQRCLNPKNDAYDDYGGRGITVCKRWVDSFEAFLVDMGPRPTLQHTVERNDVNGNYEPDNCCWATKQEQVRNRRNTIFVDWDGNKTPLSAVADQLGMKYRTLLARIQNGETLAQAIKVRQGRRSFSEVRND